MSNIESTIIIPVYNKWELTRQCLKSLAATVDRNKTEIIVVDNASSDATPKGAPFLGQQLFGKNFKFARNEENRNFAGACNQGAELASGHFLIFLNNDTIAEKGWYEPLISDFERYPDIAGTGPLLVYPDPGPWGRPVQHLGVLVSPFLKFGHLYNGVPETSALAKKRRFFQVITGACLVIKKPVFMEAGRFDEKFINGLEDVDLCGRLGAKGYRFTVNPDSVVVHLESQTPGRNSHEAENFQYLIEKSGRFFRPDWGNLLEADGFALEVTEWLRLKPGLSDSRSRELAALMPRLSLSDLKDLLPNNIYWQDGWDKLLAESESQDNYIKYIELYFNFFRTIPNAAKAIKLGRDLQLPSLEQSGRNFLKGSYKSCEDLLKDAQTTKDWFQRIDLVNLAAKYEAWLQNYDEFKNVIYPYYMKEYFSLAN